MKGLKGIIIVATIVAAAAVLSACEKQIDEPPLKFGVGGDAAVEKTSR